MIYFHFLLKRLNHSVPCVHRDIAPSPLCILDYVITSIASLQGGAENTQRALRLTVNETVTTNSGVLLSAPFSNNGPAFTLPMGSTGDWLLRRGVTQLQGSSGGVGDGGTSNTGTQPRRITVYVKVAPPAYGTVVGHWGAHIAIHEMDYRPSVNGQPGNPPEGTDGTGGAGAGGPGSAAAFGGVAGDGGEGGGHGADAVAMIGVAIVDGKFKHDSNYRHTPGTDLSPESPHTVAYRNVMSDHWYKIDIFIDWDFFQYKVRYGLALLLFTGSAEAYMLRSDFHGAGCFYLLYSNGHGFHMILWQIQSYRTERCVQKIGINAYVTLQAVLLVMQALVTYLHCYRFVLMIQQWFSTQRFKAAWFDGLGSMASTLALCGMMR